MLSWLIWVIIAAIPGVVLIIINAPKRTVTMTYLIFCAAVVLGWAIYSKLTNNESTDGSHSSTSS